MRQGFALTVDPPSPQHRLRLHSVGRNSAAHSADRPSHAPRYPSPRRMRATWRRTPSRNAARRPAASSSKNFQPRMSADERRCRRDRLLHQAGQPLQKSYPRSSAFIRGKIVLPSVPIWQVSHTTCARAAGPRAPALHPSQGAPTPGPTASFKPFRIDPLNREPATKSATAPFKPSRTDPLNREPALPPNPTHFTPTRAAAEPRHDVPRTPRHTRPPHQPPPAPPPPDHHIDAARHNPCAQRNRSPAPPPPDHQTNSARRNPCAQRNRSPTPRPPRRTFPTAPTQPTRLPPHPTQR